MTSTPHRSPAARASLQRYWRLNILVMSILLALWALVGLGCGILWADLLNRYRLPGTGYPLGFWFAQQGSILTFVLLILIYALVMNRLDRHHRGELERIARIEAGQPPSRQGGQGPPRDLD